jgi:hypothetical protein
MCSTNTNNRLRHWSVSLYRRSGMPYVTHVLWAILDSCLQFPGLAGAYSLSWTTRPGGLNERVIKRTSRREETFKSTNLHSSRRIQLGHMRDDNRPRFQELNTEQHVLRYSGLPRLSESQRRSNSSYSRICAYIFC